MNREARGNYLNDGIDLCRFAVLHPMLLNPTHLLVSQAHLESPIVKPGILRKSSERVRNINRQRVRVNR